MCKNSAVLRKHREKHSPPFLGTKKKQNCSPKAFTGPSTKKIEIKPQEKAILHEEGYVCYLDTERYIDS